MSTHAMVSSAVQELLLMGALDRVLAPDPVRSRFLAIHEDGVRCRERFTPFLGIDYGLCVPRNLLDKELVDAARSSGVDVRERCGVEQVLWENDRPVAVVYRSGGSRRAIQTRVIVGADGRKSRMAAEFGVWEPYRGSKNGRGFAFRYFDDPLGPDGQEKYGLYRYGTTISLILPSCPRSCARGAHV